MQRDKNIKLRVTLSLIVAMAFISAVLTRCANIGSPSGGPRDSLAPLIVAMTPDNFTTNMDTMTRRIYIEFNEFVKLVDQQTQFYTSPQMKNKPQLQIRGRGIVVTMRDTLKSNTTYALNFGSSVQDNNEGNPINSMRYVFSTGSEIDSMIISGYTEDAFKADSVSGTYILLYAADSVKIDEDRDSTIFNATPSVIARAENNGIFLAQNLKPIPYYIYALQDNNGNLTYEPGVDKVGFITGAKNPSELGEFSLWFDSIRKYVVAEPQLHFRMFLDKPFKRQMLAESSRPLQNKAILNFGANYPQIDSIILDSIPSEKILVEYMTKGRDTMTLWFDMPAEQLPDTLRGRVVYYKHDSLNKLVRTSDDLRLTWRYIETKEAKQEREKQERDRKKAEESGEEWVEPVKPNPFKYTLSTTEERLNPEKRLSLTFDFPLKKIDTAAITFTRLTAEEQKILDMQQSAAPAAEEVVAPAKAVYQGEPYPFKLTRDTQNIRRYYLDTKWEGNDDKYFLTIPKGTFTDILEQQNDSIVKSYSTLKRAEFATVVVNLKRDSLSESHYILELLSADGSKVIETKKGVEPGQVTFNYVPVGGVTLRIVQDKNNNGEWDSGDLILRRQSERANTFSQRGESVIETRVNWEVEVDVDPSVLFAPETQKQLAERLEKEEQERLQNKAKALVKAFEQATGRSSGVTK